MLGYENAALIALWETLTSIEVDTQGSHMCFKLESRCLILTAFLGPELRILDITSMAVRIPKMQASFIDNIDLIWGQIITKIITSIVSKPQVASFGVPIKANCIADSSCIDFELCAITVHPGDRGIGIALITDIARCANRNVQLAIGSKCNKFPTVRSIAGEIIFHDNVLGVV